MNYKKSLLSLVTIMALNNAVVADDSATYMPLASDTVDSSWILFGVNGFSTGVPSTIVTGTTSFSAGTTTYTDTVTSDAKGTLGADGLVTLQALAGLGVTTLSVGINVSGVVLDQTEAVRSMYMKVGSTVPNVRLEYKISLEGKTVEILLNGTLYTATINEASTWANALTAATGSAATTGTVVHSKTITDLLDFNFSNNPVEAKYFDSTIHLDTVGQTASFYHFNAITQQWEVNQKGAPTAAQDFTKFTVGKGYWGRADVKDALGAQVIDTNGSIGLILGAATALSGIPDPTVYVDDANATTLATGWNMLAFDDNKPFIRHAATGLVLSGVVAGSRLVIIDDSGLNSIQTDYISGAAAVADVIAINRKIESQKRRGLLPGTFNIKAFPGSAAGTLVLVSDKKFTVGDANTTSASNIAVVTLNNAQPYVNGSRQTVGDINNTTTTRATSAYGEYTTIIDPLYGTTSADSKGGAAFGFSKLTFSAANPASTSTAIVNHTVALAAAATIAGVETGVQAIGTGGTTADPTSTSPVATQIDSNFNGAADMLIVSYANPFSIKDATYTRVFDTTTTAADGVLALTVSGSPSSTTILPALNDTAAQVATKITAVAATTGVYAAASTDTTPKLIAVSTANSTFDVKDVASGTVDILAPSSSDTNLSKGAIAGVYSIDHVARLSIVPHEWAFLFTGAVQPAFDTNESVNIKITDQNGSSYTDYNVTVTTAGLAATAAGRKIWFDTIVAAINGLIAPIGRGFAIHDFDSTINDFQATKIYVSGLYLTNVTIDQNTSLTTGDINATSKSDSKALTAGTLGSNIGGATGDIASDLKANPAYSPNYATYGPLYTLRNASTGYDVRAMLQATTEMDTATADGNITWSSIDITRNENEWFLNNEFNLFNISHNAGYWAYLTPKTAATVAIVSATFTNPAYTYYFSNATGLATTNTMMSGQLSVTITGLKDTVAGSAYAAVGGEDVQLTRSGVSDTFTGNVSRYALKNFVQATGPISITVRAVNGKGEAVSASGVVTIDYSPPTNVTAAISGTSINLGSDGNTSNFYVFNNYIPEVEATRTANLVATVTATGGNTGVFTNACSTFTFGTTNNLRIVAADGTMNSSNLSDAKSIIYASTLKGASVITHAAGSGLKSQNGQIYDSSCALTSTQTGTENAGVSLATLISGQTAYLSFAPIFKPDGVTYVNFTQDVAWTSNYEITNGTGAIVQIQSAVAYAGKTFFLQYNGLIYTGTFPSTQVAADASIGNPIDLTVSTAANATILP